MRNEYIAPKTFIELCVSGDALPHEIDDHIEQWHNLAKLNDMDMNLSAHLGFTHDEYSEWILNPEVIDSIIASRSQSGIQSVGTSIKPSRRM